MEYQRRRKRKRKEKRRNIREEIASSSDEFIIEKDVIKDTKEKYESTMDQILLNLVGRGDEDFKTYKKDVLDWRK